MFLCTLLFKGLGGIRATLLHTEFKPSEVKHFNLDNVALIE